MKIIYLHQYFNTPDMPGGTRSYEMARRLIEWGHEVHMVTSWREPTNRTDWFTTEEAGIKVHWLPVLYGNHMSYRQRIKAFFDFAWKAGRKAASIQGDVVFATSTPLTIALPGVYAAKRQKIPMVFEVRDLWPELPIAIGALKNPVFKAGARLLERFAYNNAARVVALSPGMAEGVGKTGYPHNKIVEIPNSSDLDIFCPSKDLELQFRQQHPELGNSPIVLYAGTLGKINGVAYFVHLAASMKNRQYECQFVIVGGGAEWELVEQLAIDLDVLNENLFMYSQLPKKKLPKFFSAATIVTSLVVDLPVLNANSANKFFDGLASGSSIAINYGGWQADLLKESGAGFVLSRKIEKAADELQSWLSDPSLLQRSGIAARKLAEERFSRDILARRLESVLSEAIAIQ